MNRREHLAASTDSLRNFGFPLSPFHPGQKWANDPTALLLLLYKNGYDVGKYVSFEGAGQQP